MPRLQSNSSACSAGQILMGYCISLIGIRFNQLFQRVKDALDSPLFDQIEDNVKVPMQLTLNLNEA